ncbi:hypothetical protein SUGI_0913760 [Cryptomeria japonica]|nr:hypothetical protein SUGI_0913760 [Cryptomeria japonica]
MFRKAANSSALTPIGDGNSGSLIDFLAWDRRESFVGVRPGKEGFKNFGRAIPLGSLNGGRETNFHSSNPKS